MKKLVIILVLFLIVGLLSACTTGKYPTGNGASCGNCDPSCYTCTNATQCETCPSLKYFTTASSYAWCGDCLTTEIYNTTFYCVPCATNQYKYNNTNCVNCVNQSLCMCF